jgi:hypothetical protein
VFVRVVYGFGRVLAILVTSALILAFCIGVTLVQPQGGAPWLALGPVALMVIGLPAVVVVHEAGHLIACLALGVKVLGVEIGKGKFLRLSFTVGGVRVSLGAPYSGRVRYASTPSAVRGAVITAAGSLANLIAAAALFAAGKRGNLAATVLFAAGHAGNLALLGLAVLMTAIGIGNLLPFRERNGTPTDGARLLGLFGGPFAAALRPRDAKGWLPLAGTPAALHAEYTEMLRHPGRPLAPEQATRWLKAYRDRESIALHAVGFVGRSLRLQGRTAELFALYAGLPRPAGPHARWLTIMAHMLDCEVLLVPGLPAEAADRAVSRVERVLRPAEFTPDSPHWYREAVLHTLALGKLRQGRLAEAAELCRPILAMPELPATSRATVLATIALARRAAGLPYQAELAEARFLDPDADLVAEACGTRQVQRA